MTKSITTDDEYDLFVQYSLDNGETWLEPGIGTRASKLNPRASCVWVDNPLPSPVIATATCTLKTDGSGSIDSYEITNRGLGYASATPPTLTFSFGGPLSQSFVEATGYVSLAGYFNRVGGIFFDNKGRGYGSPPMITIGLPPQDGFGLFGYPTKPKSLGNVFVRAWFAKQSTPNVKGLFSEYRIVMIVPPGGYPQTDPPPGGPPNPPPPPLFEEPKIVIKFQPQNSTVAANQNGTFTVLAFADNDRPVAFEWECDVNSTGWQTITAYTNSLPEDIGSEILGEFTNQLVTRRSVWPAGTRFRASMTAPDVPGVTYSDPAMFV